MLQVSVPGNSLLNIVTVRCGHCSNLLSVNMGALLQALPFQNLQVWMFLPILCDQAINLVSFSAKPAPEKRQRAPSAYNRFINSMFFIALSCCIWAHFPRIHFGLNIDDNKQAKLDEPVSVPVNKPGGQKGHSFC
ncbi:hypothetical protein B296_00035176 [Ensete ventricosum]|uniref:Uncharacterized protein n=1 Tax=Ensete ventricosum TaxID=4639 RepID=A0A426Y4L1_ENSVE|nr:hypothetical protein B296_00035176 [Ensete ventricosum]